MLIDAALKVRVHCANTDTGDGVLAALGALLHSQAEFIEYNTDAQLFTAAMSSFRNTLKQIDALRPPPTVEPDEFETFLEDLQKG